MAEREWPEEAREHFERGYHAQMAGRLDEAVECYRRSLALYPSAEAHTFIGWAFSYQGKHEEAIAECRLAIAVDPTFGNPYNDIGAYLIELGREAIRTERSHVTSGRMGMDSIPIAVRDRRVTAREKQSRSCGP